MAQVLNKYLSLFKSILKISFIADLEYRTNFSLRIFTDIIWYVMQIMSFEVLFNYSPQIGGWNRYQMRVFLALLFLVDSIFMIFFQENIDRFSDKIRKGELDLVLTKPVNSQFLVSLQKMSLASIANLLMSVLFFIWSLCGLENFSWTRLLWLVLVLPTSVIVVYTTRFMFCCLNLIFVKADSVQFLWYNLYRLGMKPDSIYTPLLKMILISLLPMSLIASVPARIILETPNYYLVIWSFLIGPLLLYLSHRLWQFSLKHYSSASS